MEDTSENKEDKLNKETLKHVSIGLLAHVDAGKTTLSESMLYTSGAIRKQGRVDNGDAFLDTHALERKRGITIFSKQAILQLKEVRITLLDTPGHVDFSAEMERTLQVLDYAILVISGADGIQGHTKTLWQLLRKYRIPVFLFINKMDQAGTDRNALLAELKENFGDGCVDFSAEKDEAFYENIAMCEEQVLNKFLESGKVEKQEVMRLTQERKLFPCYFGSALKSEGVLEFLEGLETYMQVPSYGAEFQARVFKIARDEQGSRLTFLKVTGGSLKVKTLLPGVEEKINQIRIYSGDKYETVTEAEAGTVCCVTGPERTRPGMGLGENETTIFPVLEPVLTYQLLLPEGYDAAQMLPKLRLLEEEEPELHVVWNEKSKEILVKVMGEVQIEILKSLIAERFGAEVEFGTGNIVYKETIATVAEGVGHFEPLRHYAEVHLLLEPKEPGSGLEFGTDCSEDILDKNWQRLVLTHLKEKEHIGVLTGSAITDMKVTLVAGKAHQKHTEGGDFRQATYRALRQGLMQAESVLLEPYYDFRLEVPEEMVGRAMLDIDRMYGKVTLPETRHGMAYLTGNAPVDTMQNYAKEVAAYTKGHGKLFCTLKGYAPCHNPEEVIEQMGYDPEADLDNPAGSVFCAHGAGFLVPWQEVENYMHVEGVLNHGAGAGEDLDREPVMSASSRHLEEGIDAGEIDSILERTYYANKKESGRTKKWQKSGGKTDYVSPVVRTPKKTETTKEYLLVDGYNVIFAWEELNELAQANLDAARGRLLDILCNYQGIKKCSLIAVFDAYRVAGHQTEILDYHNIHVVFTKEAETADQFIEKFAHENGRKYKVTVATSDGLEQIIIRGQGCTLISAREFQKEIEETVRQMKENYKTQSYVGQNGQAVMENKKTYLLDNLSEDTIKKMRDLK